MNDFREFVIAVLGCGARGLRWLRTLRGLGCRRLVVYDDGPDPAAAEAGTLVCRSLDMVWDTAPDVVFVAAPAHRQSELAWHATGQARAVFVEKPLAGSEDGLEELVQRAAERNSITMAGCPMRFHPGPARVRELLRSGVIGNLQFARIEAGSQLPEWRPGRDYRGTFPGPVLVDCMDEIDMALWQLGPASLISAANLPGVVVGVDTESTSELLLSHASGALTSVHRNWRERGYHRGCRMVGTEGSIAWNWREREVVCTTREGVRRFGEPAGWQPSDMHVDEARYFLQCVASGRAAMNGFAEAHATHRLALAARNFPGPQGRDKLHKSPQTGGM